MDTGYVVRVSGRAGRGQKAHASPGAMTLGLAPKYY